MVISRVILVLICLAMVSNIVHHYLRQKRERNKELYDMYKHTLGLYHGSKGDIYVLHDVGFYAMMSDLEDYIIDNYRKHPNNLSLYEIGEWIKENNYCK